MNTRVLATNLAIFTGLQLAMVLAGHWIPYVKDSLFAPLGTFIALLGGVAYARAARPAMGWAVLGGALVGGLPALIGIAVSWRLGDVDQSTLFAGTSASIIAGFVGGVVARMFFKPL